MRFEFFKSELKNLLRKHVLLVVPLALYIVFEVLLVMPLPVVGIHAWNESIYLSFVNYLRKSGNPFVFRAVYDPFRPDYNVGYLFFWASYAFHSVTEGFFARTLEVFLSLSRVFSLVATLISSLLIYVIAIKLTRQLLCAYVAVVTFLFSPLVLYFGTKFQLEPFTFLIFLFSWLLTIRYAETAKLRYIILGFAFLGALIATRQIFAIYTPALLLPFMMRGRKQQQKHYRVKITLTVSALILGFLGPLVLTQLIVPEYIPIKFQFFRLAESPKLASQSPWQTGNLVSLYFQKSLLPSLGLSFLFVPILIAILPFLQKNRIEITAFLLGGAVYFIFAFYHNINHMYHTYYLLPLVILALVFVTSFPRKSLVICLKAAQFHFFFKPDKVKPHVLIIFFLISSVFSIWETTSFYGVGSNRIYRNIDGYGNLDSVFAGYLINKLYHTSKDNDLLSADVTYYSLVQSPAVYFYEEMPSLSYYDFFAWNTTRQEYEGFNFFVDQESFLQALRKRNLFILTITPDMYQTQNQSFQQYVQKNFVFIAEEGVYTFYLNRTIFNQAPAFYKNKALRTLMELESSQIAPSWLSQYVMNMSTWYRISKRSPSLGNVVLNEYQQTFYLGYEELSNRSLSLEISLIAKLPTKMKTIVSLDDVVNVRFGDSNDVHLEIGSTVDDHHWILGADISKFYWQNLTLTFVYEYKERAEIYFNGILISKSCPFSLISLLPNHFIKIISTSNVTDLYSLKLWNRALSDDEIQQIETSKPEPMFLLPYG
jgi:4-amino-4-deoxy-L-arabinose transferase-like glycosyltransferase